MLAQHGYTGPILLVSKHLEHGGRDAREALVRVSQDDLDIVSIHGGHRQKRGQVSKRLLG